MTREKEREQNDKSCSLFDKFDSDSFFVCPTCDNNVAAGDLYTISKDYDVCELCECGEPIPHLTSLKTYSCSEGYGIRWWGCDCIMDLARDFELEDQLKACFFNQIIICTRYEIEKVVEDKFKLNEFEFIWEKWGGILIFYDEIELCLAENKLSEEIRVMMSSKRNIKSARK